MVVGMVRGCDGNHLPGVHDNREMGAAMSNPEKTLVYYFDERGRRLAIAEVERLPVAGDVFTLYKGHIGHVVKVIYGHISDSGYSCIRVEVGGLAPIENRVTLD